jgi:hypothetical protein
LENVWFGNIIGFGKIIWRGENFVLESIGKDRKYWLLSINGTDVRHCKISQASDLIKVSMGLENVWFGKIIWRGDKFV